MFANHDRAYAAAIALHDAGVAIAAVIDARVQDKAAGGIAARARAAGLPVLNGCVIRRARGRLHVKGVDVDVHGGGAARSLDCDLVAVSGGYSPAVHLFSQARGTLRYDETSASFLPDASPMPIFAAGSVRGASDVATAIAEGDEAASRALQCVARKPRASTIVPDSPAPPGFAASAERLAVEPLWAVSSGDDGKCFVDLQDDVTVRDIALAAREGYRAVEHLKRYTTLGMARGLRGALDIPPDPTAMRTRVDDAHFRGSILVAAVFDAYFSTYLRAAVPLFRIYRAGGGDLGSSELPVPLADALADAASTAADEFFQLCARALDYCPPVDLTFGDYLRALVTASTDLRPEQRDVRQALMQSFRARGILADSASFFSEDALVWPRVPDWTHDPVPDALPPVVATIADPRTGVVATRELEFGHPDGLTKVEKDVNGAILRQYARENAARLGFVADPRLEPSAQPYPASFHTVFRVTTDGRLRIDMNWIQNAASTLSTGAAL